MGEVKVEVELINAGEHYAARRGLLDEESVTRFFVHALVDTGATDSVLPAAIADRLGIRYDTTVEVLLADGTVRVTPESEPVEFVAMSRDHVEHCLIMGDEVIVGQLFLERTDLFVDAKRGRLVGNPEHPDRRVHKVRRAAWGPVR